MIICPFFAPPPFIQRASSDRFTLALTCSASSLLMASANCSCSSSSPLLWGHACSASTGAFAKDDEAEEAKKGEQDRRPLTQNADLFRLSWRTKAICKCDVAGRQKGDDNRYFSWTTANSTQPHLWLPLWQNLIQFYGKSVHTAVTFMLYRICVYNLFVTFLLRLQNLRCRLARWSNT